MAPRSQQLRFPNPFRLNLHGRRRIPSVDNAARPVGEFLIVHTRVGSRYDHSVE